MKLLATDMDGTFLRDDKSYSEEFNDLYKQMLKQGIQFVIASGNQYEALVCKFDDDIKDDLYYLCENGTKIVYRGDVIYKHCLETDDYQHALNILKEDEECMLVVSGVKHAYILKKFEDRKDFITLFIKFSAFISSCLKSTVLESSFESFKSEITSQLIHSICLLISYINSCLVCRSICGFSFILSNIIDIDVNGVFMSCARYTINSSFFCSFSLASLSFFIASVLK